MKISKAVKIILLTSFIILILGIFKVSNANSIQSISMDIYVDQNGNAKVTENWICNVNQGTEVYHPYYNLGNSKITNLSVSDRTRSYDKLSSWNTSGTLDSKAYKSGINNISDGIELCWGISKYGNNTYKVTYDISNFVSELTDAQMIYWTLIPYEFSNEINDVKITIYSDTYFKDTIDVWGYGNYGGLCYVADGKIHMQSDGTLKKSEYMTILAKFPKGTFNTTNNLNRDFNHYFMMAEEGSTKYEKPKESIFYKILGFIISIWPFWLVVIMALLTKNSVNSKYGFKFGEYGKKIPKDTEYWRDIPCNGDIFKAYYIAFNYGLIKKKTDILGAIILKWLKDGVIKTENREGGKVFKKEDTVIIMGDNSNLQFEDSRETELFHMMYVASKDGILENKEFEKWCRDSYTKILNWFDDILITQRKKLVDEGLIVEEEKKSFAGGKYVATLQLKEEAIKIAGLKKYLIDYTLIKEREAIEVELFESYLIFAQILGIADQVAKQFKKLYPDIIEQSNYQSYDNIYYINYCASRGISSANSARAAAESYSSGGGGFSSGGGRRWLIRWRRRPEEVSVKKIRIKPKISTYYLSVKKNDFIRTRDKELVGEENDKYDEGENIEEFNRIINIWNDESKEYTLVEENIITNEYKEHLEELEALRKVYGYYFEYSQGTGKLLSCKQTDLDYDKQVEDIKRAKEAVLNKYKNARDFELNGIACVYISEEEKTYVIKLKKSDSYKCIACYKNGTNFEVKELWDFYYAYVTPVSDKLYSENFEEFSNKVGVSSPVHRPLLELARSSKNYNDYLKDMDSIFFWEDTKIYSNSLATGCTLIRGVENQFLKDNTIYNARSEEEIKENEKNVSKKDMDKIKVRITCSEFDGSFFFENDILQPFVNELKKLSSPTINFGFEGTTNIKDRFKMELKDIGTGKIYYSSTKSEYGDIYGVPLKKGNNTFEITISDNYGNVRVIKNSINL